MYTTPSMTYSSHSLFMFHILYLSFFSTIYHYVHTIYMHENSLFSYALIRSFPDDPGFVRPDTESFMLLIKCSMRLDMLQGAGVSFYLFWYYFLPFNSCWFCSFPDSLYTAINRYSFSVFMWYHMWAFICSIAVILIDFL